MDSFISGNERDTSSQAPAQASGSRRQRQAQLDTTTNTTGEGATAANKRQKPRRVSKLSLPRKPREPDANGLFERSSNDHGSASLRERLAGRPASGRRLGDVLPTSRTNVENETPLVAATQPATKAAAPDRATTAAARCLADAAVAASSFRRRGQRKNRRGGVAVESRSSQQGIQSASGASSGAGIQDLSGSGTHRRGAVHPMAPTARAPIPLSLRVTDFFPRSEVAPNVVRVPPGERSSRAQRLWGNDSCAGGEGSECDDYDRPSDGYDSGDMCLSCGKVRRCDVMVEEEEEEGGEQEEEEESYLRETLRRRGSRSSSRAPAPPNHAVAPPASSSSTTRVNGEQEVAGVVGSTARSVVAAGSRRAANADRAAAAAEKRAAAAAAHGVIAGGGDATRPTEPTAVVSAVEAAASPPTTEGVAIAENPATVAAAQSAAVELAAMVEAIEVAREAESAAMPEDIELAREVETLEALAPATESARVASLACFRRRGMAALWLKNRQRTGGRRTAGVDNAGQAAFQRRALSSVFMKGLKEMRLRMGRVAGSRTGAGAVRGVPDGAGGPPRERAGVSCLSFDSMGALLAAGGTESVSVYDFDEYVPQIPRVKASLESGVRAYLQPSHCIQTKRAVSCVRWNPANENQLAVSFLHYNEIQVFDLEDILPDADATPALTLSPGGGASGPVSGPRGSSFVRTGRVGSLTRSGSGGGMGAFRGGGAQRGLGHLSLEFVLRDIEPGRRLSHLLAGGRGGAFRVWRLGPTSTGHLTPYIQVQLSANPRRTPSSSRFVVPPDVTAVCCISQNVAIVGTDTGVLATYSLHTPEVKAFQSGKSADRLAQWALDDPRLWRGEPPDTGELFQILSVRRSPDHEPGVIVCGLRTGRAVVFDTRSGGRALGITNSDVSPSVGYCQAGPGGDWGPAILSCSRADVHLLATSARAALDSRRVDGRGRDSRLRPGPGWALGEAGGGGFRVEESRGYDLCLPMKVTRVVPGKSGVVLSRDARSYLCCRAQVRLLASRMVTSSIVIGGEEYSVEAMGHDGTTLVLDRRYEGPQVGESRVRRETVASQPSAAAAAVGGRDAVNELADTEEGGDHGTPEPTASQSGFGSGVSVIDRDLADGENVGVGVPRDNSASASGHAYQGTGGASERQISQAEVTGVDGVGRGGAVGENDDGGEGSAPASTLQQRWDNTTWRPNDGARVFAKLRAVFDDGCGGDFKPSPALADSNNAWGFTEASSLTGDSGDEGTGCAHADAAPPWASLQTIGRARLDVSATAITCHPRMNFVLLGLSDGTVVAVLPGGQRKKMTVA